MSISRRYKPSHRKKQSRQAARADILHLLASKLAPPPTDNANPSPTLPGSTAAAGLEADTGLSQPQSPLRWRPARAELDPPRPPDVDLGVLSTLRELLTSRLYRFLAHKDEILVRVDGDSTPGWGDNRGLGDGGDDTGAADPYGGGERGGGGGAIRSGAAGGASRSKGKQRAPRRRGGCFQLVPLRLLENRGASKNIHTVGGIASHGNARQHSRGRGIVSRDAIGHLLKCCWTLVPAHEGSVEAREGGRGRQGRGATGPGKRAEAEAIARVVLGGGAPRDTSGEGGGRMGGVGVFTREGEALVAVVEFLEGGGGMEVRRRSRRLTVHVPFYAATPIAACLLFE